MLQARNITHRDARDQGARQLPIVRSLQDAEYLAQVRVWIAPYAGSEAANEQLHMRETIRGLPLPRPRLGERQRKLVVDFEFAFRSFVVFLVRVEHAVFCLVET